MSHMWCTMWMFFSQSCWVVYNLFCFMLLNQGTLHSQNAKVVPLEGVPWEIATRWCFLKADALLDYQTRRRVAMPASCLAD